MKHGAGAVLGLFTALVLAAGCTTVPSEPTQASGGSTPASRPMAAAPRDYASACAPCHDRGGFGVRVLADRLGAAQSLLHAGTRMPPEAIRVVVRRGLGAMPAMSRAEVSDRELQAIIDYLGRVSSSGSAR